MFYNKIQTLIFQGYLSIVLRRICMQNMMSAWENQLTLISNFIRMKTTVTNSSIANKQT